MSETLRVKRPCGRRWSDLVGDDVRRFCADCKKFVYNLDAISSHEIDTLRRGGGFCATYIGDETGSFVMQRPTPATSRAKTAVATAVLASVLISCGNGERPTESPADTKKPALASSPECERESSPSEAFAQLTHEEQEKATERFRRLLGYLE